MITTNFVDDHCSKKKNPTHFPSICCYKGFSQNVYYLQMYSLGLYSKKQYTRQYTKIKILTADKSFADTTGGYSYSIKE